jgi:hypothetical protein
MTDSTEPRAACANCCFFKKTPYGGGLCRWRPTYVERMPDDWCGQFEDKRAAQRFLERLRLQDPFGTRGKKESNA